MRVQAVPGHTDKLTGRSKALTVTPRGNPLIQNATGDQDDSDTREHDGGIHD